MSAHPDFCDHKGRLGSTGIAVYECMTGPGKIEVADLCEQLRMRLAQIAELETSNKDLNSRRLDQLGRGDRLEARVKELEKLREEDFEMRQRLG